MARAFRNRSIMTAITIGMALLPIAALALDTIDTRLLATPAITEGKIAFVYADDIWVADADGSNPRRVTSHPGEEQNPYFSPDGKHIAFTASYDGNVDVYVIPTEGGEPTRLTWHPGDDVVRGFTPDGKVLFSSQRAVFSRRHTQFYTIGVDGRRARSACRSRPATRGPSRPTASSWPIRRSARAFRQWKNYRGGTASRIWVLKLDDLSHEEIPKPAGGCNDTEPMWIGETVYFLSDRDGEFNLYSYDRHSKKVTRCTHHDAFPIASASAGAGKVIYEQAGWIHLFDPGDRQVAPAQDRRGRRPGRDPAPLRHRTPSTSATSGSRPAASGPCSSIAARSSPSRPRREIRTTSPRPRACTNARRPGRPTASRSPISPTRPGEYAAGRPPAGRQGRRPVLSAQGGRLLRAAGLVARQQEDRLHRQRAHPLLDRPGHGRRQADRRRADLRPGPGLADEVRLVARLEVAGLLAHQPHRLPGDLALRARSRTSPTP